MIPPLISQAVGKTHGQLDEPNIKERNASLDAERHAIAVLEAQESRKSVGGGGMPEMSREECAGLRVHLIKARLTPQTRAALDTEPPARCRTYAFQDATRQSMVDGLRDSATRREGASSNLITDLPESADRMSTG